MHSLFKALTVAVSLFALGACTAPAGTRTVSPPVSPQSEYTIGPGDSLQVFVWEHADLSVTVPVRPDGRISTPLVQDLVAAGRTPSELSRDLETALSEYVRSPKVNVIVTGFVGAFDTQVRVVGQAVEPRAIPYRQNMTLLDVMIEVGGLAEFAAGNRARIIRREGNQETDIPVRINDLLDKGKTSANVAMRPGDVLIIPESRF